MKKLLTILGLIVSFSSQAESAIKPIVIAQDPSARVTLVSLDGITPYLIDTGNSNIKRFIKGVQITKFFKDQMIISQTEIACDEGLERSLWARDGDTNELLSAIRPWTRVSGSSLKIYDMLCVQGIGYIGSK